MPTRAPRLCPRCRSTYRGPRCETCEERRIARQPPRSRESRAYSDPRWVTASKAYLREHPLCESTKHRNLPDYLRPAARHVDHVDGKGLTGPRAWDPTNWQGLCPPCHSSKTAMHDRGFGNKPKPYPTDEAPPF